MTCNARGIPEESRRHQGRHLAMPTDDEMFPPRLTATVAAVPSGLAWTRLCGAITLMSRRRPARANGVL